MYGLTEEELQAIRREVKKNNGFSKRLDILQVLSYVIIATILAAQVIIVIPAATYLWLQITGPTLVLLATLYMAVLGAKLTLDDPTDLATRATAYFKKKGIEFCPDELAFFCNPCNSWVEKDTKHCRICNRCVLDFDHHCRWTNNCVSKTNYGLFLRLVLSLAYYSFVVIIVSGATLVTLFTHKGSEVELSFSTSTSKRFYLVGLSTLILIGAGLAVISIKFYLYHLWLKKEGLTTYKHLQLQKEAAVKASPNQVAPTKNKNKEIILRHPSEQDEVLKQKKNCELSPVQSKDSLSGLEEQTPKEATHAPVVEMPSPDAEPNIDSVQRKKIIDAKQRDQRLKEFKGEKTASKDGEEHSEGGKDSKIASGKSKFSFKFNSPSTQQTKAT